MLLKRGRVRQGNKNGNSKIKIRLKANANRTDTSNNYSKTVRKVWGKESQNEKGKNYNNEEQNGSLKDRRRVQNPCIRGTVEKYSSLENTYKHI